MSAYQYKHFLQGTNLDDEMNSTIFPGDIDFENSTLKLEDIMIYFQTTFSNHTHIVEWKVSRKKIKGYSAPPMYTSYQDWNRLCFTRKSEFSPVSTKNSEALFLNLTKLMEQDEVSRLHIYVHYPEDFIRNMDRQIIVPQIRRFNRQNSRLDISISQIRILRKRPDAKQPCNPNTLETELQLFKSITKQIQCIPGYWKFMSSRLSYYPICNTTSQLDSVSKQLLNTQNILRGYHPPCIDMSADKSVNYPRAFGTAKPKNLALKFIYMDDIYEEIVNKRNFDLENFGYAVGGFIGMFLGISLLQVPEVLGAWISTLTNPFYNRNTNNEI